MRRPGLVLDNNPIGTQPAESSYRKLAAMRAGAVGVLHTGGTRHGREVYDRCEGLLDKPHYILRVGGHRQTADEWLQWMALAISQVPRAIISERRIVVAVGNEPSLEGWADAPAEYGALYRRASEVIASPPLLFACPSVGAEGWQAWLDTALAAAERPAQGIVNLYDFNTALVGSFAHLFPVLYVGEVNTLRPGRVAWLRDAFAQLEQAGVIAATVFIAGGRSDGAWDEGFIISEDEAAALAPQEDTVTDDPRIQRLLDQNALITAALVDFRHGRFTGADGMDGKIVALNGGQLPAGWAPTYPPKA